MSADETKRSGADTADAAEATRRIPPPKNAEEALERARRHARAALAESLETVRALLDAASLSTRGAPAETHPWLSSAYILLESLTQGLAPDDARGAQLGEALAGALDNEIARWERRGREDAEARAVLRAFLGLRELLWEFGVRSQPAGSERARPEAEGASTPDPDPEPFAARRPRVQRIRVQG